MAFVESNGARIHWEAEGEGTPVLLIMGHLYSSRLWYPLMPALTKKHRVIRFDNRGTGHSDVTSGPTIEQFTADALAVLDAAGEATAHIYGVSMGGGIAAEFGMRYSDRARSVTLGCTMLKTEKTRVEGMRRLLYSLPTPIVRAILKRTMKPEAYGSAAPREAALHDMGVIVNDRFTMRGAKAQSLAIANYATTEDRATRTMTMPVLILHGDEDNAVPVACGRDLARIIPGSRYVEFPGAGHNYLVAANAESTAAFIDFIEQVDRAAVRAA